MLPPEIAQSLAKLRAIALSLHSTAGSIHIPASYFLAPGMLLAIFLVHFIYFRKALCSDGQQVIQIDDLTNVASFAAASSFIEGDSLELCVNSGKVGACHFPVPPLSPIGALARPGLHRFSESLSIENKHVFKTLICAEDLMVDGITRFHGPVKVAGDLFIRGNASFDQPVIVNGVLRVEGHAHFSSGLVTKGDARVTGEITIGSRDRKGWAVLRHLTLEARLRLNGELISDDLPPLLRAA